MSDLSSLWIGFSVYIVGTATPGPGNMTIANAAMLYGRKSGLAVAAGVIAGSLCWGTIAASGLAAFIMTFDKVLFTLKIAGAAYLFWLGYKALAAIPRAKRINLKQLSDAGSDSFKFFLQGFSLHLTNPKAVITWLTVVTLGLPINSPAWASFLLVGVCGIFGCLIFSIYALSFSAKSTENFFLTYHKQLNIAFAGFYFLLTAALIISLT